MPEIDLIQARRVFLRETNNIFDRRILAAKPIKVLSDDTGKRVEVIEEPDGSQFVWRLYSEKEEGFCTQSSKLPFLHAFQEMQNIFTESGISVVPNTIRKPLANGSDYSVMVICEYLNGDCAESATTEAKMKVASGFGTMLASRRKFLPSLQVLSSDMLRVKRLMDNTDELVLVDLDPYLEDMKKYSFLKMDDHLTEQYIKRIISLLWDRWSRANERIEVMSAFTKTLAPFIYELDVDKYLKSVEAFMTAHIMTQGVDLR